MNIYNISLVGAKIYNYIIDTSAYGFGSITQLPVIVKVNINKIYDKLANGVINYSSLFVQTYTSISTILLSGGNTPNPMSYSYNNGLTWVPNNNASSYFTNINSIAFNGSMWVAVGLGNSSIAYSID
jgi:hypothetical protein